MTPTKTQIEIFKEIDEWYTKNYHMFKTDQYYGIDILADIHHLVLNCISIATKEESNE